MLLRRITQHVRDQNWFAVFIDFIIVVVGVFIGIQVANWNETQTNKINLANTLKSLDSEVLHNIKIAEYILDNTFIQSKEVMVLGRESLSNCSSTPEGIAALERLLFHLVADTEPNFQTVVQDQLARQEQYQILLSDEFRQIFAMFNAKVKEEYIQLKSHYDKTWLQHITYHPSVTAYFSGEPGENLDYEGWGFKLASPLEEVCKDPTFRNRFINTLGFYTAIERRLIRFIDNSKKFREHLKHELEKL